MMTQRRNPLLRRAGQSRSAKTQLMRMQSRAAAFNRGRKIPTGFFPKGPEVKAVDIAPAFYVFNAVATSNLILLNGIVPGNGYWNRIGGRVELKSLKIRGQVEPSGTCLAGGIRLMIVYDRQPTGALPAISNIIQSRDQLGATANSGTAELNLDQRDRYSIVRDIEWYTPSVTFAAGVETNVGAQDPGASESFCVNKYIPLKGLGTFFSGSSSPSTIADISTGALYALFFISGGSTASAWTGTLGFRLRYKDA